MVRISGASWPWGAGPAEVPDVVPVPLVRTPLRVLSALVEAVLGRVLGSVPGSEGPVSAVRGPFVRVPLSRAV